MGSRMRGGTDVPATGRPFDMFWKSDSEAILIRRADTTWAVVGGTSVYGSLVESNDPASGGILLPVAGTYVGWTTSNQTPVVNGGVTADQADVTADNLTIPFAGDYFVGITCSYEGDANSTYTGRVHINGSPSVTAIEREMGASSRIGSGSAQGVFQLANNDVLDLRWKSTTNNADIISISYMSLFTIALGFP